LLIVPVVGLFALLAAVQTQYLPTARNLAIGITAALFAGLLVTTPPWLWHTAPCDALGTNMVLLSTSGAIGLAIVATQSATWSKVTRLLVLAAFGAAGAALFFAVNPTCLRGPYGQMSPEANELWLSTVWEAKTLVEMLAYVPVPIAAYLVFSAVALIVAYARYRRERSTDAAALLAMLVISLVASMTAIKFIPYGSFLAAVPIALFVAQLNGGQQLTPLSAKLLGTIALNQSTLVVVVGLALSTGGASKEAMDGAALKDTNQCRATPVIQSLAKLPKGFVVASVDFGPYIVALTRHDVLAAPYHRIDGAIVESYKIMRSSPEIAEQKLRALDADYLVECLPIAKSGQRVRLDEGVTRESLIGRLSHGETVSFLDELKDVTSEPTVRVWRVKRRDE
jgi:hypothetical protein